MRKTENITKYDPEWQLIRAKVKGPMVSLEDKLTIVGWYYNRHKTVDAFERCVNWLEGLSMGYRSSGDTGAIERIAIEIFRYNGIKPSAKEPSISANDVVSRLKLYPYQDRLLLWKDLFDRNKKWLTKGYFHEEHNNFTECLYKTFTDNREQIPPAFSKEKLDELVKKSANTVNTHKFFF